MARTTLVREVLGSVSTLLEDISPQFTRYTEAELLLWLNDAQMAIATYLPHECTTAYTVKLQPGSRQSIETIAVADAKTIAGTQPAADIKGLILRDVVRNMGINGTTPGRAIRIVDRDDLDLTDPDWHTKTAAAVRRFCFDPTAPRLFWVSPGPAVGPSSAVWVELILAEEPAKIAGTGYEFSGDNSTVISIDDCNRPDIVAYMLARAYLRPRGGTNAAMAAQWTQVFTASLNARVAALTGINPNLKRLPFAPERPGAAS